MERAPIVLDHEKLHVYQASIKFVAWSQGVLDEITRGVSALDHLVRASSSISVNVAEASGKMSAAERGQYSDTAYGSALECAACLDVLNVIGCIDEQSNKQGKTMLSAMVSMLVGFRKSVSRQVKEDHARYLVTGHEVRSYIFDHEKLSVYQKSLSFFGWINRAESIQNKKGVAAALDRSSTSIVLNIAEGNGKYSMKDRSRFISHARTAALQSAAHLDVFAARNQGRLKELEEGKRILVECVRMLVGWQNSISGSG